jgi:hypothetical protein
MAAECWTVRRRASDACDVGGNNFASMVEFLVEPWLGNRLNTLTETVEKNFEPPWSARRKSLESRGQGGVLKSSKNEPKTRIIRSFYPVLNWGA